MVTAANRNVSLTRRGGFRCVDVMVGSVVKEMTLFRNDIGTPKFRTIRPLFRISSDPI